MPATDHQRVASVLRQVRFGGTLAVAVTAALLLAQAPALAAGGGYDGCGVIVEGQSGDCVTQLQNDLDDVNADYNLPVTGFFGPATRTAVLDFQGRNDLPTDGNAGPEVQNALTDQATADGAVSSPTPGTPSSSADSDNPAGCSRSEEPTAADYASGAECSPANFPYTVRMETTKAGARAQDPFNDGCSKAPDTGWSFDFRDACATHDYLADLQRAGAKGVSEPGMDHQLLLDTLADCEDRTFLEKHDCEKMAFTFRAFVQQGDYTPGDTIDTSNN